MPHGSHFSNYTFFERSTTHLLERIELPHSTATGAIHGKALPSRVQTLICDILQSTSSYQHHTTIVAILNTSASSPRHWILGPIWYKPQSHTKSWV
jgi:hypothetical protein